MKELKEPTEVTLRNRTTGEIETLGVWFPRGTEPTVQDDPEEMRKTHADH